MREYAFIPSRGRARLTVDLSRLLYNYRLLSRRLQEEGIAPIAVLKANAYGHGAVPIAAALYRAGARRFAVSSLEEGLALRASLPSGEILVMGYVPPEEAPLAADAGLSLTVHSLAYAKTLSRHLRRPLSVHIKLNSGMNRTGFPLNASAFDASIEGVLAAASLPHLSAVSLYSHLATADEAGSPHTARAVARFRAATIALSRRSLVLPTHLAASAAVLGGEVPAFSYARLGLALYGYSPSPADDPGLLPVARLTCRVAQIYTLPRGEAVGYGATYRTARRTRIAILPIGYADGVPRAAEGGSVYIGEKAYPIVGRISMDALSVSLAGAPRTVRTVRLFGGDPRELRLLAEAAGTIPYEILSRLGPRIVREYEDGEANWPFDP